ncbi:hypothetical protein ACJMK2_023119 [Sinanodonta woodiana]|uniref:C1q domain-containing protein n=1 Tax=Sinanodonta woodiana TaxID=1069815 RepID=A0ABD3T379_SINWO
MIAVNFTRLIFALCAFVITAKAEDSSYDSSNDLLSKLIDRMEKMETKMKEMEIREDSMRQEIRILKNDLYEQKEETNRLKSLITLVRSENYNRDDVRIPKEDNHMEFDSKGVNNGNKTSKPELRIRQTASQPVAFSTYLTDYVYHLGINQVIKYNGVLTNEGNAYNALTGIFTCPEDGLYLFSFFATTINNQAVWVRLMVDDINVSDAVGYSLRDGQDDQGGNVAILRLTAGQSVWTSTQFHGDSTLAGTRDFRHVTFSGVRLSD